MPLFSAKLDYALRAAVDLALQPSDQPIQSREIAARQNIRGPYLDQILAVLKREGIVRSIRGAGGGYTLARSPSQITVGQVVRAVVGDQLLLGGGGTADPGTGGASYVVRKFEEEVEHNLETLLDECTIGDLAARQHQLEDTMSIMPGF